MNHAVTGEGLITPCLDLAMLLSGRLFLVPPI